MSFVRALACSVPFLLVLACGPDSDTVSGGEEWEDGRTLTDTYLPKTWGRVDIIIVIDDSPSMRAHLPTMAGNVGGFADVLTSYEGPDARVAITTTSVAGPTCAGPRAQGGAPLVDSCRAHLDDFVGPDEHGENGGGSVDLAALCEEQCSLDSIERVQSAGSTSEGGLAVRPWFDSPRGPEGSNLAEGVDYREALSCALLQGFGGCMFESPLEAAARMVERYADPSDTMFGFRRPGAALMVVVISDEDDCSHPDSSGTIFSPEGEQVFWPAGASEPLSGICVNASVVCEGEDCSVVDKDLSGVPTSDPAAAALSPSSRLLDALEAAGEYQLDYEPLLSVVGGFSSDGSLFYGQPEPGSEHEAYAASFGIGPSCAAPGLDGELARAVPGGRLAAMTDILTPGSNFSICDLDWSAAFEPVLATVKPGFRPWCFPGVDEWACVEGLEVAGELPAPDCVVEVVAGSQREQLPACERDAEGNWLLDEQTNDYAVPAGADACWVYGLDTDGQTASELDDAAFECTDSGARGHLKIARSEGASLPYDAYYALRCRPC